MSGLDSDGLPEADAALADVQSGQERDTIPVTMTAAEEAARAGIDLTLIEVSLNYSYDERALQHQAALELALELERIGQELRRAAEPADA